MEGTSEGQPSWNGYMQCNCTHSTVNSQYIHDNIMNTKLMKGYIILIFEKSKN